LAGAGRCDTPGGVVRLSIGRWFATVVAGLVGCRGAPGQGGAAGAIDAGLTGPAASASAGAPTVAMPSADRFETDVRPIFAEHGCATGSCHGMFKGGGMYLVNARSDFESVAAFVDVDRPEESLLLRKALGEVPHVGGRNLRAGGCDARRIEAWIRGAPGPTCTEPRHRRDEARFDREVRPALEALGCAATACHGGAHTAKLDLTRLRDAPERARAAMEATGLNRVTTWLSPVVRAAMGELAGHPAPADPASCAIRRLYRYAAESPEETCPIGGPAVRRPDRAVLRGAVMPLLARRGCMDTGCHGGGGSGSLSIFDPKADVHVALHDYLVLTARLEPGVPADQTTLLLKTRNVDPHGGGKRLGGDGDCFDAATVAWIRGRPPARCSPRSPPSFDDFKAEIQGVLDRMTCSQASCHGGALDHYKLVERASTDADLRANYAETVAELDLDYMPFSPVMLRMREPCAYSVTGAWIEGAPRPACTLVDPDPRIFPRVAGAKVHPGGGMGM
jgi:hypothetical protein